MHHIVTKALTLWVIGGVLLLTAVLEPVVVNAALVCDRVYSEQPSPKLSDVCGTGEYTNFCYNRWNAQRQEVDDANAEVRACNRRLGQRNSTNNVPTRQSPNEGISVPTPRSTELKEYLQRVKGSARENEIKVHRDLKAAETRHQQVTKDLNRRWKAQQEAAANQRAKLESDERKLQQQAVPEPQPSTPNPEVDSTEDLGALLAARRRAFWEREHRLRREREVDRNRDMGNQGEDDDGMAGAMQSRSAPSVPVPTFAPQPFAAPPSFGGGSTAGMRCRPGESVARCTHR